MRVLDLISSLGATSGIVSSPLLLNTFMEAPMIREKEDTSLLELLLTDSSSFLSLQTPEDKLIWWSTGCIQVNDIEFGYWSSIAILVLRF